MAKNDNERPGSNYDPDADLNGAVVGLAIKALDGCLSCVIPGSEPVILFLARLLGKSVFPNPRDRYARQ